MLLQTNSYVVPKEKRAEHARLLRRFRQALARLGCTDFEVYEQVGTNWSADQAGGRFVQIMRFRDRKHQLAVQAAEKEDPVAQALVAEFCELINFPYQQENNLFAVGYYTALMGPAHGRAALPEEETAAPPAPARSVDPFGEAPPDLSRMAQEFIRSRPPAGESHPFPGANGAAAEFESMEDSELPEEPKPAQHEPPVSSPAANGNGKYAFQIPQYATTWGAEEEELPAESAPAAFDSAEPPVPSLDELLDMEIGQTAAAEEPDAPQSPSETEHVPDSESSGIGHILEASLADDELDIALPAELIDPGELANYSQHSDESHPLPSGAMNEPPHRG